MPDRTSRLALADALSRCKDRSNRSYDALARRTGLSRSTVHRYCTGALVPDAFGPIESIGRACDATPAELSRLYQLWSLARDPQAATETGTPGPIPAAEGDALREPLTGLVTDPVREPVTGPMSQPVTDPEISTEADPPAPPTTRTRRRALLAAAGVLVAGVVVSLLVVPLLAGAGQDAAQRRSSDPGAQRIDGPTWTSSPTTVSPAFFGVTINSNTGTMPTFAVGSVRLWDSATTWSLIEPRPGRHDWSVLDRQLAGAESAGLPVVFTFGATPRWASPFGPRGPYPDHSRASPPDDLRHWDDIVRAVATRYRDRIAAYELWVLAPSPQFYTGTPSTLAVMSRRASRIIRAADPRATLVCPSFGELWKPASRQFLTDFAAAGGYDDCDVAGVKLHPQDFGQAPETIFDLTSLIDRTMREAGVQLPVWSTGTSYRIATAAKLNRVDARNYAVRLFLVALYARYERMYFYNWGGQSIPIVLQGAGGPPTEAALAVQTLQRWLVGARIYACGHGRPDGLPPSVRRCRFRLPSPIGGGPEREASILWSEHGVASTTAAQDTIVERLDGRKERVAAGQQIAVGEDACWAVVESPTPSATPGQLQVRAHLDPAISSLAPTPYPLSPGLNEK